MSRKSKLFFICHFYPLFMACHLQFGNGHLLSNLLFVLVPLVCFVLLISIWINSSVIKLQSDEKSYLTFFVYFIIALNTYYVACYLFSEVGKICWIEKNNQFMIYYIVLVSVFYFVKFFNRGKS